MPTKTPKQARPMAMPNPKMAARMGMPQNMAKERGTGGKAGGMAKAKGGGGRKK